MQIRKAGAVFLAGVLTFGMSSALAFSQDGAKQDMKNAGAETKSAAKDTGHGISTGTQKAYHKTKRGTKKAYHKTKRGVKNVGHKMDPDTPANPQQ